MRPLLVLALAIPLVFLLGRHTGDSARRPAPDLGLSTIASEVAARPVQIQCEGGRKTLMNANGESGSVGFLRNGRAQDFAVLEGGICATLHTFSQSTKRGEICLLPCRGSTLQIAWSLNALAHEAYHLAGVRDEASTECYALQAISFVAQRLGATVPQGNAIAHYAYANLPPRMPKEYRSPECRNGGKLDLRPRDPDWP
jgi:hypothetical protein